ncbi:MAG: hypothetical protein IKY91_09315 [Akkermansia sp.]|nr:hypothetical protein [Akkermansia sp.]
MNDALWQAVHAAYEERNPDEARRLLSHGGVTMDCSRIWRCGDEDYIRWLLSLDILQAQADSDSWPGLQEIQLQCPALPESARPACIMEGLVESPAAQNHH